MTKKQKNQSNIEIYMNEINRMLLNCEVDLDAGKCWYIYIIIKIRLRLTHYSL